MGLRTDTDDKRNEGETVAGNVQLEKPKTLSILGEEVEMSKVGGDYFSDIDYEVTAESLPENDFSRTELLQFLNEGGRVFVTVNNSYVFVLPIVGEAKFPNVV